MPPHKKAFRTHSDDVVVTNPPWFKKQLSPSGPISLTGKLLDQAEASLYRPKLHLPSPITHTSGHPAPHSGVKEETGPAQREHRSLSNWSVCSPPPPRQARKSGEFQSAEFVGADGVRIRVMGETHERSSVWSRREREWALTAWHKGGWRKNSGYS